MPDTEKLPLLILCGGQSSRMGSPKALLPVNGGTLLDYLAAHTAPERPLWLADDGSGLPAPARAVGRVVGAATSAAAGFGGHFCDDLRYFD